MNGRLVERGALTTADTQGMFLLLAAHFDNVTEEQFLHDLYEKDWVLLVENGARELQGFSTLQFCRIENRAGNINVVYSGDTIVHRAARGSSALLRTWLAGIWRLRARAPDGPLYWLLLTSGVRTYRLLPTFCRDFYPRHERASSHHLKALADDLAQRYFGQRYDPVSGIVRLAQPQLLREDPSGLRLVGLGDPHIQYFLSRNPGHIAGDELVCIAELSEQNLTPAGRRVLSASAQRNTGG